MANLLSAEFTGRPLGVISETRFIKSLVVEQYLSRIDRGCPVRRQNRSLMYVIRKSSEALLLYLGPIAPDRDHAQNQVSL